MSNHFDPSTEAFTEIMPSESPNQEDSQQEVIGANTDSQMENDVKIDQKPKETLDEEPRMASGNAVIDTVSEHPDVILTQMDDMSESLNRDSVVIHN